MALRHRTIQGYFCHVARESFLDEVNIVSLANGSRILGKYPSDFQRDRNDITNGLCISGTLGPSFNPSQVQSSVTVTVSRDVEAVAIHDQPLSPDKQTISKILLHFENGTASSESPSVILCSIFLELFTEMNCLTCSHRIRLYLRNYRAPLPLRAWQRSGTWDDVRTVLTAVKEPAIRVKPMSTWKDLESGSSDR